MHTNYAACRGMWYVLSALDPKDTCTPVRNSTAYGVIIPDVSIRLADITDGTSNTMLFGERARGIMTQQDLFLYHWWQSGWWSNTQFDTNFAPNGWKMYRDQIANAGWWFVPVQGASSFHPGGVNASFCDGSVRFLKDSIASWSVDGTTADPVGLTYGPDPCAEAQLGLARPAVYQALSTRNGGEVISADAF